MNDMRDKIAESLKRLENWIESHQYRGYEPFDGLSSFLRPLTFHTVFGERLLQQFIRQSPVNLRPLLGVKTLESTKGMGYIAWGYLKMFRATGLDAYKERAIRCLEWLDENRSPHYRFHSWGNHFDYSSRSGKIPKYEPTIVWTSLIGQVYLEAYEILRKERYLEVIKSIMSWILALPREQTASGTCLSYVTYKQSSVHNSNMLGAAFLASAAGLTKDMSALGVARESMDYSCSRQRPDGSWFYGDDLKHQWVDNFHTGYNLDSLKRYVAATGDSNYSENLRKGFKYFKDHFFEDDGCPRYYHNRTYPIDIQCASQAIDTLCLFSEMDEYSRNMALRVASWTIDNMQDKDGHFYYRKYPLGITAKAPMLHWGQATTYKALASVLLQRAKPV